MEELDKLKKRTKKLKIIFILLFLLEIICFSILFIIEYYTPKSQFGISGSAESQKIPMFNSKYTPYIGKHQTPAAVKALIETIETNNHTDKDNLVELIGITKFSDISNNSKYTIECSWSDCGYINKIKIIEEKENN